MTVLVTGGAGFIGSQLCERLLKEGYEVRCLDNLQRFGGKNIRHLANEEAFELVKADIKDKENVSQSMENVETVFHMAAQSNVEDSIKEKDFSFNTNVLGTWNVLRASEEAEVRKFVFASSREVFGDQEGKTSEEEPLEPKNYYGASKATSEHYMQQFGEYSEMQTVSVRIANAYGPKDKNRVIPIFLEKALKDEEIELYGGDQILDFVWIKDVIDIFLEVKKDSFNYSQINVGSGEGTSIEELATKIKRVTSSQSAIVEKEPREYETTEYITDTSRMEEIGVSPTNLDRGLKETKKYYEKHLA